MAEEHTLTNDRATCEKEVRDVTSGNDKVTQASAALKASKR